MTAQTDQIIVGTAGYGRYPAPDGWKEEYDSKLAAFADAFSSVELNRTFYKLPQKKTARRWRMEAGEAFDFCVKAWQALTHETSSPTWRKNVRDQLNDQQKEHFGMLRPHPVNFSAWEKTKAVAEALDASVCLIQTPPSFGPSEQHRKNMKKFFGEMDRGSIQLAWEPRGEWRDHRERIEEMCRELNLIHVVDPLRTKPVDDQDWAYIRLHGLNEDRYDYRYDYSSEELNALAEQLEELSRTNERVYCMFNNDHMFENVRELESIL